MVTAFIPPGSAVSEPIFRKALRQFASGVTIITTVDEHGFLHGMTATAFSSLSLQPPLVLVAVGRETRCHRYVIDNQKFGVSILYANQANISRHFGGIPSPEICPDIVMLDGVPVLDQAIATLSCRLENSLDGGDHSIFVGRVSAVTSNRGDPLLHFEGEYHSLLRAPNSQD